jgi:hypothetical protein
MDFDFKVTTWKRVTVSEEHEQQVLDAIKGGSVTCANDIFGIVSSVECKKLDDTDEPLTPEENGGSSTIEVLEGGDTIFTNGE